jgi:dTDP-4-amino-4,6-dideoxygalactose transaminase
MAVPFYNFQKLHNPEFQEEVKTIFSDILSKNAFVEGEYNDKFEAEFAKSTQTNHCLLLANGTDALEIGLQAYGVGAGDEVAISAISFFATAECVYNMGATPVFVDVDPKTGLMDPASLERVLEKHPKVKAIIPVHIYGLPAPIEVLEKICEPKGIKIVEDGAQSQGGFYENGKPIGSSNHLITYSFYPTKNLGAFGDAGAINTQSDELAEKIKSIRNHGRSPNGHALIGRNSRCDHLQAAVLYTKLKYIDEQNNNRIQMPDKKYIELSSWHLFPIQVESNDLKYKLKDFLGTHGVGSALFYEKSLPEEKPIIHVEGEKENSISFAAKTLCLPMNPFISREDVEEVAERLTDFFSEN